MSTENPKHDEIINRISTGVGGLDEILKGGLMRGRSYLVVGEPGCGKTLLTLQCLTANPDLNTRYITLAESAADIARNTRGFGWDLGIIDFIDLAPAYLPDDSADYQVFSPHEVEQEKVWKGIAGCLREGVPDVLVIDSVTQLGYLSTDDYQFRKRILALVSELNRQGCTTLFVYDPAQYSSESSVGLAVDAVIRMKRTISPGLGVGLRSISVEKLRGSDFLSGLHPLQITATGIKVFPHRIESLGGHRIGDTDIQSGIASLDTLVGGGLDSGTTSLVSGPAGAGKSSLGLQVLAHNAGLGRKGVLYTFEESRELVIKRCQGIGMELPPLLASDTLRIRHINPLEFYPDEFLGLVRDDVENHGFEIVMVDSLRGYELAMEEFGMAKAHIHNLVTYLNRLGVTTLLISEVEHITSNELKATDIGVSHLADTVILMRHAEYSGRVIKIISCLKKRTGGFLAELRELQISEQGLEIGESLRNMQGVLTGIPSLSR